MSTEDKFPFGLKSREALVVLHQRTYPKDNIKSETVEFGDMYGDPTPTEPGRTFIELDNKLTRIKRWSAYWRLDIAQVVKSTGALRVKTPITTANIIAEINRSRNMFLTAYDFNLSDTEISDGSAVFDVKLPVLSSSYMYYGELDLTISPVTVDPNIMRQEDNVLMLQEDGTFMLLEEAA